jgi:hypothetical protein
MINLFANANTSMDLFFMKADENIEFGKNPENEKPLILADQRFKYADFPANLLVYRVRESNP